MARTPSPTGLYWSERGTIGCAAHTPYEGSDTWNWERWEPVPVEAIEIGSREAGLRIPRCETCGREATAMKGRNEIAVEKTFDLLRAYWDDRANPAERVEMLKAAGEFDRDLRYMRPEEVEALAAAPFGALAPRMLLALAMAHLNELREADHEAEVAERRAGWSTTP